MPPGVRLPPLRRGRVPRLGAPWEEGQVLRNLQARSGGVRWSPTTSLTNGLSRNRQGRGHRAGSPVCGGSAELTLEGPAERLLRLVADPQADFPYAQAGGAQ